ncbi:uncharacterized protein BCR38DRAFT_526636 [Pseudomassariella vexata]|uniref:Uncharacterized protein n=1 Tax=Pseudomassariella vexata TaxID=1141098 RepID=A0A1Y2DLR6_9PEZI|nr:uncharacterized protein BCR38DRAFT_526636 [Pseudomassariella vexata]ORY60079.1 hypothetical protein BCR38DRAFT_526636 [Pseudomassariella vexata]
MYDSIRKTRTGRYEFVRGHRHHHRHHKCFDECAGVSIYDWDELVRQYNVLYDTNAVLTNERDTLKTELQGFRAGYDTNLTTLRQEIYNLRIGNQRFIDENRRLADENHHLKDEEGHNEQFKRRIKDMKRQLDEEKHAKHELRAELRDSKRTQTRWEGLTETLRTKLAEAREDLGMKNDIVVAQNQTIIKLERLLRSGRDW